MSSRDSFTGYQRVRKTRLSVRVGEILSRFLITFGGIGTLIAILLVCFFLVWVTIPLFFPANIRGTASVAKVDNLNEHGRLLQIGVDPDQIMGWSLFADGTVQAYRLDTGEIASSEQLFAGEKLTAVSSPSRSDQLAVGFQNGSVRLGKINVNSRPLPTGSIPPALQALSNHASVLHDKGIVHRDAKGVLRQFKLNAQFDAAVKAEQESPVVLIDLTVRSNGPVIVTLQANGILHSSEITVRENQITGEIVRELQGGQLQLPARSERGLPQHLLVSGVGDSVFLAWEDGHLMRISTTNLSKPTIAEELKVIEGDARLTVMQFMIGKTTLLCGDSAGRVRAWFRTGPTMQATHELPAGSAPVTALAVSARSRIMAAGYADGTLQMYYLTNEKQLASVQMPREQPVEAMAFYPKEDGLLAVGAKELANWSIAAGHPEVSFRSLFLPVWYEGYSRPAHVWQSSSADDAFEPKFGLWPLIFGTLKATFYSLLIGVPLALGAAIYTREFLHAKTRAIVKPTIEIMASLPSVVLGFLAALVIAPFVESIVPVLLTSFFLIPAGFILGSLLWPLLPAKLMRRLEHKSIFFIAALVPCSIYVAGYLAPLLEDLLFQGNLITWLSKKSGPDIGGWMLLLFPVSALVVAFLFMRYVNPRVQQWTHRLSSSREAYINLGKFFVGLIATALLALLTSFVLSSLGFDPRHSFLGVYVQRNSMIVGIMMGFAIIPIIYTIAEDALSSVPDHLRSASLACGATPWQTATRIIIPTALSGLFSAVMVGLGRAVGETMVVLMAAGNTPVLEMNFFNGFRTLSANIAVELPEAVKDSTHYRILFLAALALFAMTFVLNTIAEAVRQRFRKRAFEL